MMRTATEPYTVSRVQVPMFNGEVGQPVAVEVMVPGPLGELLPVVMERPGSSRSDLSRGRWIPAREL